MQVQPESEKQPLTLRGSWLRGARPSLDPSEDAAGSGKTSLDRGLQLPDLPAAPATLTCRESCWPGLCSDTQAAAGDGPTTGQPRQAR